MKIRMGFVSNSSSTSFCVYGITTTRDVLMELWQREHFQTEWNLFEINYQETSDGTWNEDSTRRIVVGKELIECPDDMTMGEFKRYIQEFVTKWFGPDKKCSIHEESWFDG